MQATNLDFYKQYRILSFFAHTTAYVFSERCIGVQLEHLFMFIVQNFQIFKILFAIFSICLFKHHVFFLHRPLHMSFLGDFWFGVRTLSHIHCPKISDFIWIFLLFFDFFIKPGVSAPEFRSGFSVQGYFVLHVNRIQHRCFSRGMMDFFGCWHYLMRMWKCMEFYVWFW
jgi:hypothetical protein